MTHNTNIVFERNIQEPVVSTDEKKEVDKLKNLAETTNLLFKAKTLFPFELFPDEITIDPLKVNIIHRVFFETQQLYSIEIKNIIDVSVDSGPLWAKLTIVIPNFPPIIITHMRREDAAAARRIIQGLIIAKKEGINISNVHNQDITPLLHQVGRAV